MKKNTNFLLHFIFGIIVIGDLLGQFNSYSQLNIIFKPMIMVWIWVYFFLQTRAFSHQLKSITYLAFLFSWLGDLFLMFQSIKPFFFIIGLACFLISQITYIKIFSKAKNTGNEKKSLIKSKPYLVLPFLFYGLIFYFLLFPNLDIILKIAVLLYAIALVSMSAMAFNRKNFTSEKSFLLIFIGAVLFVISDSLIGVNKFLLSETLPMAGLLIMGTYIPAQYLIMMGITSHIKMENRPN